MNYEFNYKKTIFLDATIEKVWEFLTKPEYTKQYMYNGEVTSNWEVGSTISWKGTYMGQEFLEKGIVLECTPYKHLKYSEVDSSNPLTDKEHVTYQLLKKENGTELTINADYFREDIKEYTEGWNEVVIPALLKLS